MAETISEKKKRLKWAFANLQGPIGCEALFYHGTQPLDLGSNSSDPIFKRFGYLRGRAEIRQTARPFNHAMPECALLRLRALIGLNARAEIYAYLCTHANGHPSGIARETGYSQKNIQDTINDMSAAHIVIPAQLVGRMKVHLITENYRHTLLYHPKKPPRWITWPPIFRALEILWTECRALAEKEMSPLLLSGKLRELSDRLRLLLEREQGSYAFRP